MASVDPRLWALIQQYSAHLHLDPYAVASVSIMEGGGRFGEVGDGGTSFGPFQMHVGGALPPGRNAAWANSPQGVYYAMQQMAHVAAGMRGAQAIQNIVRRFERPAAPAPEVAGAISNYQQLAGHHLPSTPYAQGRSPGATPLGGKAAALVSLLLGGQHGQAYTGSALNLRSPGSILQGLDQQPQAAGQPEIGTVAPVQQASPFVTPGGSTPTQLQSSLDATRQALLRV